MFDTPGLETRKKRKQDAEAISQALKASGVYKMFFVMTMDMGRVRPADIATMQIVLNAAPITNYAVIMNRCKPRTLRKLNDINKEDPRFTNKGFYAYIIGVKTDQLCFAPFVLCLDGEDNMLWDYDEGFKEVDSFIDELEGMEVSSIRSSSQTKSGRSPSKVTR